MPRQRQAHRGGITLLHAGAVTGVWGGDDVAIREIFV